MQSFNLRFRPFMLGIILSQKMPNAEFAGGLYQGAIGVTEDLLTGCGRERR
jgi:hypothetical protein